MPSINKFKNFLLGRLFSSMLGILTIFISVLVLGPESFGVLTFVLTILAVLIRFFSFGLGQAIQLSVARNNVDSIEYHDVILIVVVQATLLGMLIFFFLNPIMGYLIPAHYRLLLSEFAWVAPFVMIQFTVSLYFIGKLNTKVYNTICNFPLVLIFIFVIAAYFFSNPTLVYIGYKFGFLVGGLSSIFYLLKYSSIKYQFNHKKTSIIIILKEGLQTYFVSLSGFITGRILILLPAWYLSPEVVGNLSISRTIGEVVTVFVGAVTPLITSYSASLNKAEGNQMLIKSVSVIGIVSIILLTSACFLLFFGSQIPYFKTYSVSFIYFFMIAPGVYFNAQQKLFEAYMMGQGQSNLLLFNYALIFIIILIVIFLASNNPTVLNICFFVVLLQFILYLTSGITISAFSSIPKRQLFMVKFSYVKALDFIKILLKTSK